MCGQTLHVRTRVARGRARRDGEAATWITCDTNGTTVTPKAEMANTMLSTRNTAKMSSSSKRRRMSPRLAAKLADCRAIAVELAASDSLLMSRRASYGALISRRSMPIQAESREAWFGSAALRAIEVIIAMAAASCLRHSAEPLTAGAVEPCTSARKKAASGSRRTAMKPSTKSS